MALLWDPREVLDVDPKGSFTCVGTAKNGARCGQSRFSNSDLEMASKILNRMGATAPRRTKNFLRPLAEVTLCPRWHRKPDYSQVEMMRQKWWNTIVSIPIELRTVTSTIPTPTSMPRNTIRAVPSVEFASETPLETQSLLTPPTPTPAPRLLQRNIRTSSDLVGSTSASLTLVTLRPSASNALEPRILQEEITQVLDSNESNLASLSLLTPPTTLPSSILAHRFLPEDTVGVFDSNESTSASLNLLTVSSSSPYTPAPELHERNSRQALGSTGSTLASSSYLTPPSSPPSPTPAPRLLQRSIRQSSGTNDSSPTSPTLPKLPPLPMLSTMAISESASQIPMESPPTSLSISMPTTPSLELRELPLPAVRANIRRATLITDPTALIPPRASLDSPTRSEASGNGSAAPTASPAMTDVDLLTPAQSPRQTPALDCNNSTSDPPSTTVSITIASSQTQPLTTSIPQQNLLNTWPEFTLERPMQPSPLPYSNYSQPNLHVDTGPIYKEETNCLNDSYSCLDICRTNILNDCSTLWRRMCHGRNAITAYMCCSPWNYQLQD